MIEPLRYCIDIVITKATVTICQLPTSNETCMAIAMIMIFEILFEGAESIEYRSCRRCSVGDKDDIKMLGCCFEHPENFEAGFVDKSLSGTRRRSQNRMRICQQDSFLYLRYGLYSWQYCTNKVKVRNFWKLSFWLAAVFLGAHTL